MMNITEFYEITKEEINSDIVMRDMESYDENTWVMEYGCAKYAQYIKLYNKNMQCVKISESWTWEELLGETAYDQYSPAMFNKISEGMDAVRKRLQKAAWDFEDEYGEKLGIKEVIPYSPDDYTRTYFRLSKNEDHVINLSSDYFAADTFYIRAMFNFIGAIGEYRADVAYQGMYEPVNVPDYVGTVNDFVEKCVLNSGESLATFGIKYGIWDESVRTLMSIIDKYDVADMVFDMCDEGADAEKYFGTEMSNYVSNCVKEILYELGYDPDLCLRKYKLGDPTNTELIHKLADVIDLYRETGEDCSEGSKVYKMTVKALTHWVVDGEERMIKWLDFALKPAVIEGGNVIKRNKVYKAVSDANPYPSVAKAIVDAIPSELWQRCTAAELNI